MKSQSERADEKLDCMIKDLKEIDEYVENTVIKESIRILENLKSGKRENLLEKNKTGMCIENIYFYKFSELIDKMILNEK